jgi:predicted ATP-dependent serine protease
MEKITQNKALEVNSNIYGLRDAGREAAQEYLRQRSVSTGNLNIDQVLEGGIEAGNYYLWLGAAKSGKSTTLRCLGMKLAESFPVLYLNFEQLGRNVFAKIYQLKYGESLRDGVHTDFEDVIENIAQLPSIPFYISFWQDTLDEKSFNTTIANPLKESIEWIRSKDPQKRSPVIIIENLSDIYNERMHGNESLVNIVTQTAQDIKNFCLKNEVAIFLAHHCGKLPKGQERPSLEDVRDSKRVVDLAHSIFVNFVRENYDKKGKIWLGATHHLAYLAGRGQSEYAEWTVTTNGLDMHLS